MPLLLEDFGVTQTTCVKLLPATVRVSLANPLSRHSAAAHPVAATNPTMDRETSASMETQLAVLRAI